jgi:hypothetical protein
MDNATHSRKTLLNGWRVAGWGSLLALLTIPALAMQLTSEVSWTASDFVFAAMLLAFVGTVVELAARFARPGAPRIGYIFCGLAAFLTFWSNAAVGIIGDDDFVNKFFFLIVIAALCVGLVVRFRVGVMRWLAMALGIGQYAIGVAALNLMPGHAVEWGFLTVFALLWFIASWCFQRVETTRTI